MSNSSTAEHYLKQEFYQLLDEDSTIFEFLRDGTLDGLWYWDLVNQEHEWMDDKFWRTLGYDPATKKHLCIEWQDIIFEQDLPGVFENFNRHVQDPNFPYDQIVRYRHKTGSTVWVRCRGIVIRDEQNVPVRMLGIHHDVTKQKEAELSVIKASKIKERFMANMSHEIRTPIHGILGLTEALLQTDLSPKQTELVNTILSSGEYLQHTLDDVLDFTKLNENQYQINPKPFNLQQTLEHVHRLMEPSAHKKSLNIELTITTQLPTQILGDRFRLIQILTNLISNGIKNTELGGINIVLSKHQKHLKVEIRDSGCGIEDTEEIFKPFAQEVKDSSDITGTGLGLAIVDQLCDLMDYRIEVESTINVGSTFALIMPYNAIDLKPSNEPNSTNAKHSNNQFKRLEILIVEDNDINATVLSYMFESYQQNIHRVVDGLEAIEYLKRHSIDLILMDINMPVMGGIEATQIIRTQKLNPQPIIIAVTADTSDKTKNMCQQAGMDDFLAKPFNSQQFQLLIEPYLT